MGEDPSDWGAGLTPGEGKREGGGWEEELQGRLPVGDSNSPAPPPPPLCLVTGWSQRGVGRGQGMPSGCALLQTKVQQPEVMGQAPVPAGSPERTSGQDSAVATASQLSGGVRIRLERHADQEEQRTTCRERVGEPGSPGRVRASWLGRLKSQGGQRPGR